MAAKGKRRKTKRNNVQRVRNIYLVSLALHLLTTSKSCFHLMGDEERNECKSHKLLCGCNLFFAIVRGLPFRVSLKEGSQRQNRNTETSVSLSLHRLFIEIHFDASCVGIYFVISFRFAESLFVACQSALPLLLLHRHYYCGRLSKNHTEPSRSKSFRVEFIVTYLAWKISVCSYLCSDIANKIPFRMRVAV